MKSDAGTLQSLGKRQLFMVGVTQLRPQVISSSFHRDAAAGSIGPGDFQVGGVSIMLEKLASQFAAFGTGKCQKYI